MRKFILIIIAVAIVSCKKEGESLPYTKVYGKVISRGNNEPVDSVRVSIWDGMPCSDPLDCEGTKSSGNYDTTYTDVNGNFHIAIYGNEPVLYLYKKGYEFIYNVEGAALGIAPLIAGKLYNNETFILDGIAYFNPILMNKSNRALGDSIVISLFDKRYEPNALIVTTRTGICPLQFSMNDKLGYPVLGDSYLKYKIEFQSEKTWKEIKDSVYTPLLKIYCDTIYF
jgi:hypothetical protein